MPQQRRPRPRDVPYPKALPRRALPAQPGLIAAVSGAARGCQIATRQGGAKPRRAKPDRLDSRADDRLAVQAARATLIKGRSRNLRGPANLRAGTRKRFESTRNTL